tara:strand:+ start:1846 stop:2571 length:726 start_codon:yes stop_codon:yes gene_type:complete
MVNYEPIKQGTKIIENDISSLLFQPSKTEINLGKKFFSREVTFICGMQNLESLPSESIPEIAFAGRSNVGKSSLINSITNRKNIARISQNPGRTQQINFFDVGTDNLRLVDLPGFGYAKSSKKSIREWTKLIYSYLSTRVNLKRVLFLLDSRRGITQIDRKNMNFLNDNAISYQIILTKIDKIKSSQIKKLLFEINRDCSKYPAAHPVMHLTSSYKKIGIEKLQADIATFLSYNLPNDKIE